MRPSLGFAMVSGAAVACTTTPAAVVGPTAAQVVDEEFYWACKMPQEEYSEVLIAYSACPESAERVRCTIGDKSARVRCDYVIVDPMGHRRHFSGRSYERANGKWNLDPLTGRITDASTIVHVNSGRKKH